MKDREIQSGWKVVQQLNGKLYSATMINSPSTRYFDREYTVNRWTRHHHKAGPLAVFTTYNCASRFLNTEDRYHNGKLAIYACKYIISKHLKLWDSSGAGVGAGMELAYLPDGSALAKCVQLRRI